MAERCAKKQGSARGVEIGTPARPEDAKGFRITRDRVRHVLAQDLAMERYGDELLAEADGVLEGLSNEQLSVALEASMKFQSLSLLEIVRAVEKRSAGTEDGSDA